MKDELEHLRAYRAEQTKYCEGLKKEFFIRGYISGILTSVSALIGVVLARVIL